MPGIWHIRYNRLALLLLGNHSGRKCKTMRAVRRLTFCRLYTGLIHPRVFHLEAEMPLQQVAGGNNNHGGKHLRKNSINVHVLYQQLQQQVIDKKIGYKDKEVPEQLYAPADGRVYKYHVLHQEKAYREINNECEYKGCGMRFKSIEAEIKNTALKKKFYADGIK